jgi:transcriptional regulator with XRE-family HTH domain
VDVRELQAILADNVRSLAREKGMTLTQVADFTPMSKQQLFNILGGRSNASIATLTRLANYFEIEPWQLLAPRAPRRVSRGGR